jgi:hypothetical protein
MSSLLTVELLIWLLFAFLGGLLAGLHRMRKVREAERIRSQLDDHETRLG